MDESQNRWFNLHRNAMHLSNSRVANLQQYVHAIWIDDLHSNHAFAKQ